MKLSISEKAPSLNRLSRARKMKKTSPSTQFSVRAILSRVYIQLDTRPIKKDYKKVVSYIRNFLTEGDNWTLNKVKNKGKKTPSLNRLNRARKMKKISFLISFSVRVILSRVYIQLDARLIEKSCREVVYSWETSNL